MAKYATKAKENIFTQARYNAAKFNDRLNSREGASEELGIDRSRLARIELGSKNPFPDEVLMMSDIYNAPELKAHFCKYMCPLGKDFPEVESEDLDRISVKALSSFRKISKARRYVNAHIAKKLELWTEKTSVCGITRKESVRSAVAG